MEQIIEAIREVLEEPSLSKLCKSRLEEIITILEGPGDDKLKVSKVLSELEDISDNNSTPSFVRSQLWNVASLLETQ